jgi:hypothetical protein
VLPRLAWAVYVSTARKKRRPGVSTNSVKNNKRVTTFLVQLSADQYTAFLGTDPAQFRDEGAN